MNPFAWFALFGTMVGYYAYQKAQQAAPADADAGAAPADAFSSNAPSFAQGVISDVESLIGIAPVVSQSMLDYIQATESFSPTPYLDPPGNNKGLYSIGYGHQIVAGDQYWPHGPLTSISQDRAQSQFDLDVARAGAAVARLVTTPLSQGQFDALTDFVFNEGQANFASSTLLKLLNAGDYVGAANEFQKWVYASGQVNQGLVARRAYDTQSFTA
jgi:GH24 family phage-related lysozyme (muramidase)